MSATQHTLQARRLWTCGNSDVLAEKLVKIFSELDIEQVSYKQWESTDRTELVTMTDTVSYFVEKLTQKLQVLKTHHFIHKQQTKFFYKVKETLPTGKVLVVCVPRGCSGCSLE